MREVFLKGVHAQNNGDYLLARDIYRGLLINHSTSQEVLVNLSVVCLNIGEYQESYDYAMQCTKAYPGLSQGWAALGTIQGVVGQVNESLESFRIALELDPANAYAANNLANIFQHQGHLDYAFLRSCQAVYYGFRDQTTLANHLLHSVRCCDYGRIATVNWHETIRSAPQKPDLSGLFLSLLVTCENNEDQYHLRDTIAKWGEMQSCFCDGDSLTDRLLAQPPSLVPSPYPIRLGFVSGDFRSHSVARFIWPLFKFLDKSSFLVYCYYTNGHIVDEWTNRFREASHHFVDVSPLSTPQLVSRIRRDRINILFDISGFTYGTRSSALSLRAAPVQVSWLGFPGTVGIPAYDYLFVDRFLAPVDRKLVREDLLVTTGTSVCFPLPESVPVTSRLPEEVRGHITYGTLNNPYKLTRRTVSRWSAVMKADASSRMLFVRREFDSFFLRQNILRAFEEESVDPERIYFYNNSLGERSYLDCYNEIDISLDTYPVTGGTTTTDALWMGVPVVTLEGPNIHQRVCSAILRHACCEEWIARTDDEFIEIAIGLASDRMLRKYLRRILRERVANSLLCDEQRFAQDFGDALLGLYGCRHARG